MKIEINFNLKFKISPITHNGHHFLGGGEDPEKRENHEFHLSMCVRLI